MSLLNPPFHSVILFLCLLDRRAFLGTLTPISHIHPLWLPPVPTSCPCGKATAFVF